MFGIGGSEILVILIVALLFLGPEKLPDAAKQISKGIRDLRKQTRALQQTIEDDEHIGGAIRDLKSALRGEDVPVRPYVPIPPPPVEAAATSDAETHALADPDAESHHPFDELDHAPADADMEQARPMAAPEHAATQPQLLGESGGGGADSDSELSLIKPPAGETAAREAPSHLPDATARKHG